MKKKLVKNIKEWYYSLQIEAYSAEYFYLRHLEDSLFLGLFTEKISYSSYKMVVNRRKLVEKKRIDYIFKLIEMEINSGK